MSTDVHPRGNEPPTATAQTATSRGHRPTIPAAGRLLVGTLYTRH